MSHSSPTAILLNVGHAMDHWIIVVFAYTWGVIAGVWGVEWTELTPFNYGALFMFGMGSIVSGRLGDLWGRWIMMVIFFAGMGVSALVIALCSNKWQIGAALTLMGAFASIYHPVGIPMLVQKAKNYGFTIGVNGLAGNMGIAIAAGVSVYIAQRFGWQMAFVIPGVICLVCAVAFVALVPREEEAPAKRKQKMIDLPPSVMARVFAIMTFTSVWTFANSRAIRLPSRSSLSSARTPIAPRSMSGAAATFRLNNSSATAKQVRGTIAIRQAGISGG